MSSLRPKKAAGPKGGRAKPRAAAAVSTTTTTTTSTITNGRRLVQTQLLTVPLSPVPETQQQQQQQQPRAHQCSPVKSARLEDADADANVDRSGRHRAALAAFVGRLAAAGVKQPQQRRSRSCDSSSGASSSAGSGFDTAAAAAAAASLAMKSGKAGSLQSLLVAEGQGRSRASERHVWKAAARMREAAVAGRIADCCQDGLEVVEFSGKGRGVVATREFARDEFVVEYKGDLVDFKVAKAREEEYNADPAVGCYMYYFVARGVKMCVDATAESPYYGRLLNHSRLNPNCYTKVVTVGDSVHLCLFAKREIAVNEELVYDYGDRDPATLAAHPWLKG